MKKIFAIGSLFLASAAFADAPKAPAGTGNFRRAEVVKATGQKEQNVNVHGVAYVGAKGKHVPSDTRVMMVDHKGTIDLVKAPLDKSKPVTKMTQHEANKMGLYTQNQAKELASQNGGLFGSKGRVTVENAGIGARGNSYRFNQTKPDTQIVKAWGYTYQKGKFTRTVTVTGSAESASAGSSKLLEGPKPTPAPAPVAK
jgi:hypothetical protein